MSVDDLSHLFAAERAVEPPAEGLEQGFQRLLADVARGAAPLPVATSSLKLGFTAVAKWIVLGFIVGVSGAGVTSAVSQAPPVASATTQLAAKSVATTRFVSTPSTAEPSPRASLEPPRRAATTVVAPTQATEIVSGSLSEELRLITAAKRELEAGRAARARAWLTEHAARFPHGALGTEREVLEILVSCSQHQNPLLPTRFAERHPSSPQFERLRRACGPAEPSSQPLEISK